MIFFIIFKKMTPRLKQEAKSLEFETCLFRGVWFRFELELELILSHMTQKPMLRVEVDCTRLHKKAKTGEGAW